MSEVIYLKKEVKKDTIWEGLQILFSQIGFLSDIAFIADMA